MSQHTPGPWIVPFANLFRVIALKDGDPHRAICDDTAPEISHFGLEQIGWQAGYDAPDSPEGIAMGKEAAANARLIAAAPDLLAACKAVVAWVELGESETGRFVGICDQIEAAIARAEGGAA